MISFDSDLIGSEEQASVRVPVQEVAHGIVKHLLASCLHAFHSRVILFFFFVIHFFPKKKKVFARGKIADIATPRTSISITDCRSGQDQRRDRNPLQVSGPVPYKHNLANATTDGTPDPRSGKVRAVH